MKPLYDFIVHVPNRFANKYEYGTLKLQRDHRWDEFKDRVSHGTIKALPAKYDTVAEIGDTLIFHHHVNQQPDKYGMGDDHYMVTYTPFEMSCQAIAVIKEDGEVHMLSDWIFLDAPEAKKEELSSSSGLFLGIAEEDTNNDYAEVYCEGWGTDYLDLKVGEKVAFTKNADYRIVLPNGDNVFRMRPKDLLYVINS